MNQLSLPRDPRACRFLCSPVVVPEQRGRPGWGAQVGLGGGRALVGDVTVLSSTSSGGSKAEEARLSCEGQ